MLAYVEVICFRTLGCKPFFLNLRPALQIWNNTNLPERALPSRKHTYLHWDEMHVDDRWTCESRVRGCCEEETELTYWKNCEHAMFKQCVCGIIFFPWRWGTWTSVSTSRSSWAISFFNSSIGRNFEDTESCQRNQVKDTISLSTGRYSSFITVLFLYQHGPKYGYYDCYTDTLRKRFILKALIFYSVIRYCFTLT